MIKLKKQLFLMIGMFSLVMLLGIITYAFFNYTRTGLANTVRAGKISFNVSQNNTISLTNAFPTDSNNLDSTNSATVTINIIGDTTYDEGVEYKVSIVDVQNTINGKELPISFSLEVNDLGIPSNDYYNDRASSINVYNFIEDGQAYNDEMILIGYFKPDANGIDGSIDVTAYLDKDKIGVSDTVSRIENNNFVYGETGGDWILGRTVLTTNEWNSLVGNNALSFKIKVEANEGTWVAKPEYNILESNFYNNNNWKSVRSNVTSIEFRSDGESPANPISSFNASDINSEGLVTVNIVDDGLGNNTYKAIIVADDLIYAPENSLGLFYGMSKLVTIDFENFRVDNVNTMKSMFMDDSNLTSVIVPSSSWNTSNVEDMSSLFYNCRALNNINFLENWDTSHVSDMTLMFFQCTSLTNVDGLINWNTSNVEDMSGLFYSCTDLINVNGLANWNTSNVTDMTALFYSCTDLINVNGLANWNTSNVENINSLFRACASLNNINGLASWNILSVSDMGFLFYGCTSLTNVNGLASWNTSNVNNMSALFSNCTSLINVNGLANWNTSNVQGMGGMFSGCSNLVSVDISNFDMSRVTSDRVMFQLSGIQTLIMPNNYTRIDDFMFNQVPYNSESFTIPKSVTTIGNTHIFYNFGKSNIFNRFIVESGSISFKTVDDILYTYDGTRLISIPRGKTFTDNTYEIPEGVTFLNELAFSINKNINTLILPNSYVIERYIDANNNNYGFINSGNSLSVAVYRYTNIKTYSVKNDNTRYMSYEGCIYSKDGSELIAVPFNYTGVLNVKSGTTTIGQEAFWDFENKRNELVTQINIPASVTTIEAKQLVTLNALMSRSSNPVTITIDSGNTAYRITNNRIVAI